MMGNKTEKLKDKKNRPIDGGDRQIKTGRSIRLKQHQKYLAAFMAVLLAFSTYVMMDTFFITRVYSDTETSAIDAQEQDGAADTDENAADAGASSDSSGEETQNGTENDSEAGNQHSGNRASGGASVGISGKDGNTHGRMKGGKGGKGHGPGGRPGSHSSESDEETGADANTSASVSSGSSASAVSTSDSYKDDNVSIALKEYRENDTTIYVADVQLKDSSYLKTAFAQGSYGKNVTAKTSEIAESAGAILAVNGDYYGAQESGYVIRNGKLYRNKALKNQEDLVIYKDGSFGIINESKVTAEQLIKKGAVQTLSFGPALVQNGNVSVSENEEVGQAMASNPRTAIGIIDENHYVFVVSDGRTSESAGLSLNELAEFMDGLGVETAYNLDGGGSSTMYFNGKVVNNPTTGGSTTKERSVSDIVYIGK